MSDTNIEKVEAICEGNVLMDIGSELESKFGKNKVESLGFFPGYLIKVEGKKIAVTHKKNVEGADSIVGEIAIGYL